MAGSLEQFLVILKAETGEFTSRINAASNDVSKVGKTGSNTFGKLASVGKAALAGIAVAAVAVGASSVVMADQYEQAHARLATALKDTGSSFDAVKGKVAAVVQTGTKFGYNAAEIETALGNMTVGTGSSAKAFANLQVAEDLAAKTGKPLSETSLAIAKALAGNLRPLKQLGIDLPFAAGGAVKTGVAFGNLVKASKTLDAVNAKIHSGLLTGKAAWTAHAAAVTGVQNAQRKFNDVSNAGNQIVAALGQRLKGQASAQAETFDGKVKALHASMQNLQIQIGTALVPILETLATIIVALIGWFEKHKAVAIALAVVIGGVLLAATVAWTVSLFAAGGALAFLISPITLVVIGVAALAAAIIYLWTHWNQVWNWISHHKGIAIVIAILVPIVPLIFGIVAAAKVLYANWNTIWNAISTIMKVVWNVVNAYVRLYELIPLRIIGAFFAVLAFFSSLGSRIGAALANLAGILYSIGANAVSRFYDAVVGRAFAVLSFFGSLGSRVAAAASGLGNILYNVGRAIVDGLVRGITDAAGAVTGAISNLASHLPGPIKHILGIGSPSKVFADQVGQWIPKGIAAGITKHGGVVHDALAALPLGMSGVSAGAAPALAPAGGGGGSAVFNVNINNPAGNGREIADQVVAALRVGYARSDIRRALGVS